MSLPNDVVYVSLLTGTIVIGHFVRRVNNSSRRQWFTTLIGLFVVLVTFGSQMLYTLVMFIVNSSVIILVNKRYCPWISFLFSFTFLIFARASHHFGFPLLSPFMNIILMMLTLKMVGLAFECSMTESNKDDRLDKSPSLIDMFHYAFCYAGILVGPYFSYRTYEDMINCPYERHIPYMDILKTRLRFIPIYCALFLLVSNYFPVEYAGSESILEDSLTYRLFFMWPVFFTFRMRMYIGFILGECGCIMAGLGCYPDICNPRCGSGPRDYPAFVDWRKEKKWNLCSYNFETVCSVREYECEFSRTIRDGMRNWNMTVQYWLATYIYRQLPLKSFGVGVTMLTSAVWHGISPGYYLSTMTIPLILMAQDQMDIVVKNRLTGGSRIVYDWTCSFLKMASFSYLSLAFLLLDFAKSISYWKSVYFVGHIVVVALYVVALVINKYDRKQILRSKMDHSS